MKSLIKLKFIFFFLILLISFTAFAQESANDEEFNIFLMLLLTIFVCGMFGAAVVGAMIASLLAVTVFCLTVFGIVSTSIVVGVYKKSLSAGFRTFLLIFFGISCGVCGAAIAVLAQYFFRIASSFSIALGGGLIGGLLGGILLTFVSVKAIRYMIGYAATRLKLV
jgi:hypothetical protein